MSKITYLIGDATRPQGEGLKVIVHISNNVGTWGKGFVLALSARWKLPEQSYREWYRDRAEAPMLLGMVDWTQPEADIMVASMIAQDGINRSTMRSHAAPIRYEAVEAGLEVVADAILRKRRRATVHMPRIGCGLAGGTWDQIEPIIQRQLCHRGISATVYDLK